MSIKTYTGVKETFFPHIGLKQSVRRKKIVNVFTLSTTRHRLAMAADADTKMFMESFKQILNQDDDEYDDDEEAGEDKEIEPVQEPAPKKQKASSPDQLTITEAMDITFAAFDYYIREYFDGDICYVDGAKNFGRSVCEKAQELKAEYKERFVTSSVIAAFSRRLV